MEQQKHVVSQFSSCNKTLQIVECHLEPAEAVPAISDALLQQMGWGLPSAARPPSATTGPTLEVQLQQMGWAKPEQNDPTVKVA